LANLERQLPRNIRELKNELGEAILILSFQQAGWGDPPDHVLADARGTMNIAAAERWLGEFPDGVKQLGIAANRALAALPDLGAAMNSFMADITHTFPAMDILFTKAPMSYLDILLQDAGRDEASFRQVMLVLRELGGFI
jgi:hypothetical protein